MENSYLRMKIFLLFIFIIIAQIVPPIVSEGKHVTTEYSSLNNENSNSYNDGNEQEDDSDLFFYQQTKITAPEGEPDDKFGWDVDIDDTNLLIGAIGDDEHRGSAYVYTYQEDILIQQDLLTATDKQPFDYFGCSVSLDGNTALIGAEGDEDHRGSAYIFKKIENRWIQQAKLTAADGEIGDRFGYSVSLDDNTALIGSYGDNNRKGAVYIFVNNNTWIQQAKLTAKDGEEGDSFGFSVSLDEKDALIGAVGDDGHRGAAYLFNYEKNAWIQQAKIIDPTGSSYHRFGFAVSIDDNTALIGSESDFDHKGSACIFSRTNNTWVHQIKLTDSHAVPFDYFSHSLCLQGITAVIGAFGYNEYAGSACVFTCIENTWIQGEKLTASDGVTNNFFGSAVSLDKDIAIIGSYGDNENTGAAYVFKRNNQAPETPTIIGRTIGVSNKEFTYRFASNDPEGYKLYYSINWGDNTSDVMIGPFPSGEEQTYTHTWTNEGKYTIQVKAVDVFGAQSDSAIHQVSIPKWKGYHLKILDFFNNSSFIQMILNLLYIYF